MATERRGAVRGANLARLALGLYSVPQPRQAPKIRRASLGQHHGHVVKNTGASRLVRAPRWYTAQSSAGTELLQKLMPDRRSAFRCLLEPKARERSLLSAQEAVFRGFRACGLWLTWTMLSRACDAHCSTLDASRFFSRLLTLLRSELQQKSLQRTAVY